MRLNLGNGSCPAQPTPIPGVGFRLRSAFIRRHDLRVSSGFAGKCIEAGKQAAGGVWPAHYHYSAAETNNNHQDKGRKGTPYTLSCLFCCCLFMFWCCVHRSLHCHQQLTTFIPVIVFQVHDILLPVCVFHDVLFSTLLESHNNEFPVCFQVPSGCFVLLKVFPELSNLTPPPQHHI